MVNGFAWIVLALILFGMVIPFWLMTYMTAKLAAKQSTDRISTHRIMHYNKLMDYLHGSLKRSASDGQFGASLVASIRELKNFPEHRDLSVLFLEEINVTGTGKFDDLMKIEIRGVEDFLLGQKHG